MATPEKSPLKPKSPNDSLTLMTEVTLPNQANPIGSVFGGVVLSWVDMAAGISASRHCSQQVVTASMDAIDFLAPIPVGWVVTIRAAVNYAARTSCEVGVRISAENPVTGEVRHTASAYVTMVAVDEHLNPVPMPPIKPTNEVEKRRSREAQARRKTRLARKEARAKLNTP